MSHSLDYSTSLACPLVLSLSLFTIYMTLLEPSINMKLLLCGPVEQAKNQQNHLAPLTLILLFYFVFMDLFDGAKNQPRFSDFGRTRVPPISRKPETEIGGIRFRREKHLHVIKQRNIFSSDANLGDGSKFNFS